MTGRKALFEAWDIPLEESINRIRDSYVGHFDDGRKWHWSAWIYITDKGRQEADRIEKKHIGPSPD
jgi:hypothetical protein